MDDSPELSSDISEDTLKGRFLTFQVGKESFGIEIRYVIEIVGLQELTEMPEMPEYIKGIINLRGKIIPVMDVRVRFGMPSRDFDDRTSIIVVDFNGLSVGLVIDSVSDVLTIDESQIMEKPEISGRNGRGYISSIGRLDNQVILLVDCGKLLNPEEYAEVSGCIS